MLPRLRTTNLEQTFSSQPQRSSGAAEASFRHIRSDYKARESSQPTSRGKDRRKLGGEEAQVKLCRHCISK
jgi:hypothetical protein